MTRESQIFNAMVVNPQTIPADERYSVKVSKKILDEAREIGAALPSYGKPERPTPQRQGFSKSEETHIARLAGRMPTRKLWRKMMLIRHRSSKHRDIPNGEMWGSRIKQVAK